MRPWALAGCAVGLGLAVALALHLPFLGDSTISQVSNLSQLLAALAASGGCALAARRTPGRRGRAWLWASLGTGCWAAGQAVWSWYELVLDREVPFPSLADVGFLLFPVAMAIGLVIWLGSQTAQLAARGRDLLDGAIIATSLLAISWVTTLGSVVSAGADSWLPLVLSLAYPAGDLIVATLVLMAMTRGSRSEQSTLVVLGLGLGGLAFADSAYVYLTQTGSYSSADTVSSAWVIGFLLVAAAALHAVPRPDAAPDTGHAAGSSTVASGRLSPGRSADPSPVQMALPYLPLVAAGVVLFVTLLNPDTPPAVELSFALALVLLVLARQFLGLLDNRRLLAALSVARDQLQHQASHDALTGLANRSLFADRLHAALQHPVADVSVLFCDLDDFKLVNDRFGHDVGDELLVVVARRLQQCVRAGDTVARLGGDEFAVLVESGHAVAVAERVVQLLALPVELRDHVVSTSASVGIAHHHVVTSADRADAPPPLPSGRRRGGRTVWASAAPELGELAEREALATLLLREADAAMYVAKGAGKGRAVCTDLAPPHPAPMLDPAGA